LKVEAVIGIGIDLLLQIASSVTYLNSINGKIKEVKVKYVK
jgi:hypothetical protein